MCPKAALPITTRKYKALIQYHVYEQVSVCPASAAAAKYTNWNGRLGTKCLRPHQGNKLNEKLLTRVWQYKC